MTGKGFFAGAAALALLAGSVAATGASNPPIAKVSSAAALKGQQTIVIGAFNVAFLFESVDNGKATGGMIGAFGGATRAKSVLVGVTPAMMQAAADAAYDDFRGQLAAKGYAVVEPTAMFAHESFAKVTPQASPMDASVLLEKNSKGKVIVYKPSQIPGLLTLPGDFVASGFGGFGMNMAAIGPSMAMAGYARATGQTVLDVVYVVDFSNVKRPGAFSFAGIKVSGGMSVMPEYSKVSAVTPAGKTAVIVLKQGVPVEGDFAEVADSTGSGDKAMQSAANVAGGVLAAFGGPGMMFGKSRTYTFTAKPAWQEGAIKAASLANERVADQMVALR